MTFKYEKQDASATSWSFPWEDLLFVKWWRLNAVSGRGQSVSQSKGAGPSVVLTEIGDTPAIQGHHLVTVSHEKMGVGHILLECLKELLFIYSLLHKMIVKCVWVRISSHTLLDMRNVFLAWFDISGSQMEGWNWKIGFRSVLFWGKTMLNKKMNWIKIKLKY